jgi:hypothetical protein
MARKLIETRKRGFFGYVTLALFWLANGLMALWLFGAMASWGKMGVATMSEAEKAGAGLGMAIGLGVTFSIWACVAIITGLFAYMTRGRKEILEVDV